MMDYPAKPVFYGYNHETGEFTGIKDSFKHPKKPEWMQPAFSTTIVPPGEIAGQVIKFVDGDWVQESVPMPDAIPGHIVKWDTGHGWYQSPVEKPEPKAGKEIVWKNNSWKYVSVPKPEPMDGYTIEWADDSWEYFEVPAPDVPPGKVLRWVDNAWLIDDMTEEEFVAARTASANAVHKRHKEMIGGMTGNYTAEERDTWAVKAEAGKAVLAGTASPEQLALVTMEAQLTGETVQELAQIIVDKSKQFHLLVGLAAGFRRKTVAAIEARTNYDELASVIAKAETEVAELAQQFYGMLNNEQGD